MPWQLHVLLAPGPSAAPGKQGQMLSKQCRLTLCCLQISKDMERSPSAVIFEDSAYVKGAADKAQSSVGAHSFN